MTKNEATLAFALLTYYCNQYEKHYQKQPNVNKYKEKWAASYIIEDYGFDRAKEVIDYYFTLHKDGHPLTTLFNSFDKLSAALYEKKKDDALRAERRAQMVKLREEWLNGNA